MYICESCGQSIAPNDHNFTKGGGLVCDVCMGQGKHPDWKTPTIKRGLTFEVVKDIDFREQGGPLISAGLKGEVLIRRRNSPEVMVDIEQIGRRRLALSYFSDGHLLA